VFAVTLGNIIARRISAPIINVRNALDDLVHGRYDTQIPKAPADEVGDLVAHFHSVRQQLREKERLQKEFLMIASHELRTPIQPILGYAELARKGVINLDKALDIITEEARRLKRLADDILDASSLEADRMNYYMDDINVAGFIREIADAAKISNTNKNAAVSINTEINIPESSIIYGDRQRLSQAIWNIINNALRFTSEGSVTLSCQAIKRNNDNYVEIKIVDTGAGIPESVLPTLFRKFASKDIDGKSKHGTGLGLFISKGIIEAHHGKISATRNKNRGTTFTITLALKSSPNSAIRSKALANNVPANNPS
jgi:signal transduction histidine kinase